MIGYCEWCGMLDHHLIDGECERCREKSQTLRFDPYDYDDEPLGYEAAMAYEHEDD